MHKTDAVFLFGRKSFLFAKKKGVLEKKVLPGCQKSFMIDTNVIYSVKLSFLTGIV